MSSGERAPLCGYIIKPSFSNVNHHFYHIFYQLFIFYISLQLHIWLSVTLVSELIGPTPITTPAKKKKKTLP
jgi:hypothetical protein